MADADTDASRTEQALCAAIDRPPWLELLALADLKEEQGDHLLANGLRWLVENGKRPDRVHFPEYVLYRWVECDPDEFTELTPPVSSDLLPRRESLDLDLFVNDSEAAAYLAAAKVVGEWLRDQTQNVSPSSSTIDSAGPYSLLLCYQDGSEWLGPNANSSRGSLQGACDEALDILIRDASLMIDVYSREWERVRTLTHEDAIERERKRK